MKNEMFRERICRAQAALAASNMDAYLVTKPEDLRYYLYDEVVSGYLLIGMDHAVLFVGRMDWDLYAHVTQVPIIPYGNRLHASLSSFLQASHDRVIGFDSAHMSVDCFQRLQAIDFISWIPDPLFSEILRSKKSFEEIEYMQQAAELGSLGYDYLLSILREGITEKEMVRALKLFWLSEGAEDVAFPPIIAFGEHAAFPHAIATDRALRQGDVVLIDIGVLLDGYCSDMTRTVAWGTPDERLVYGYSAVAEAQRSAMELCHAGVACSQIYEEALRVLKQYALDEYFFHGLGHGVGRCVHEYPRLSAESGGARLSEGMTITVEPGVYFPNLGGIRIEDTLVIGANQPISLTSRPVSSKLIVL